MDSLFKTRIIVKRKSINDWYYIGDLMEYTIHGMDVVYSILCDGQYMDIFIVWTLYNGLGQGMNK